MGAVTIIKPTVRGEDGPLGYKISNVSLSVLSDGDAFDPSTGEIIIAKEKPPLVPEKLEYDGNFLLNDIGNARCGHVCICIWSCRKLACDPGRNRREVSW